MKGRYNAASLIGFALSVGLLAASLTAALLTDYYNRSAFQVLGGVCENIIELRPEAKQAVAAALKQYKEQPASPADEGLLLAYGYDQTDFQPSACKYGAMSAAAGLVSAGGVFLFTLWRWRKKEIARINGLADYLERVNSGTAELLFQVDDGDFSKLQDQLYKTVTMLCQTRDQALKARNNFADNLSNIAHQIKTPITAISLSAQMMEKEGSAEQLKQIGRQLSRLEHLEEALLLLSRIDAGTLVLEKKEVDVFTVLMLAADNLQEIFSRQNVSIEIPESGEMTIYADLDWTMEALMNLMKNCLEHTPPGGAVHCSYGQNPLYTEIHIWDDGPGFAGEDIPHLFERFYRGKHERGGGIGIGLSISKSMIESQNGTVNALNLPNGGACFEIRMYSH
ncbi:MAG: HAMP domain-containing histidine kinase [Enterocloster asparagiformis]|nr:HAMP domain-containing histidine kinase [Enterocloster asparagiformis]